MFAAEQDGDMRQSRPLRRYELFLGFISRCYLIGHVQFEEKGEKNKLEIAGNTILTPSAKQGSRITSNGKNS